MPDYVRFDIHVLPLPLPPPEGDGGGDGDGDEEVQSNNDKVRPIYTFRTGLDPNDTFAAARKQLAEKYYATLSAEQQGAAVFTHMQAVNGAEIILTDKVGMLFDNAMGPDERVLRMHQSRKRRASDLTPEQQPPAARRRTASPSRDNAAASRNGVQHDAQVDEGTPRDGQGYRIPQRVTPPPQQSSAPLGGDTQVLVEASRPRNSHVRFSLPTQLPSPWVPVPSSQIVPLTQSSPAAAAAARVSIVAQQAQSVRVSLPSAPPAPLAHRSIMRQSILPVTVSRENSRPRTATMAAPQSSAANAPPLENTTAFGQSRPLPSNPTRNVEEDDPIEDDDVVSHVRRRSDVAGATDGSRARSAPPSLPLPLQLQSHLTSDAVPSSNPQPLTSDAQLPNTTPVTSAPTHRRQSNAFAEMRSSQTRLAASRANGAVGDWTTEEDQQLREAQQTGKNSFQISNMLGSGRSASAVRSKLRKIKKSNLSSSQAGGTNGVTSSGGTSQTARKSWSTAQKHALRRAMADGYDAGEIQDKHFKSRTEESVMKMMDRLWPNVIVIEREKSTFPNDDIHVEGWLDKHSVKLRRAFRERLPAHEAWERWFRGFVLVSLKKKWDAYRKQMKSLQEAHKTDMALANQQLAAALDVTGETSDFEQTSRQRDEQIDLETPEPSSSVDDSSQTFQSAVGSPEPTHAASQTVDQPSSQPEFVLPTNSSQHGQHMSQTVALQNTQPEDEFVMTSLPPELAADSQDVDDYVEPDDVRVPLPEQIGREGGTTQIVSSGRADRQTMLNFPRLRAKGRANRRESITQINQQFRQGSLSTRATPFTQLQQASESEQELSQTSEPIVISDDDSETDMVVLERQLDAEAAAGISAPEDAIRPPSRATAETVPAEGIAVTGQETQPPSQRSIAGLQPSEPVANTASDAPDTQQPSRRSAAPAHHSEPTAQQQARPSSRRSERPLLQSHSSPPVQTAFAQESNPSSGHRGGNESTAVATQATQQERPHSSRGRFSRPIHDSTTSTHALQESASAEQVHATNTTSRSQRPSSRQSQQRPLNTTLSQENHPSSATAPNMAAQEAWSPPQRGQPGRLPQRNGAASRFRQATARNLRSAQASAAILAASDSPPQSHPRPQQRPGSQPTSRSRSQSASQVQPTPSYPSSVEVFDATPWHVLPVDSDGMIEIGRAGFKKKFPRDCPYFRTDAQYWTEAKRIAMPAWVKDVYRDLKLADRHIIALTCGDGELVKALTSEKRRLRLDRRQRMGLDISVHRTVVRSAVVTDLHDAEPEDAARQQVPNEDSKREVQVINQYASDDDVPRTEEGIDSEDDDGADFAIMYKPIPDDDEDDVPRYVDGVGQIVDLGDVQEEQEANESEVEASPADEGYRIHNAEGIVHVRLTRRSDSATSATSRQDSHPSEYTISHQGHYFSDSAQETDCDGEARTTGRATARQLPVFDENNVFIGTRPDSSGAVSPMVCPTPPASSPDGREDEEEAQVDGGDERVEEGFVAHSSPLQNVPQQARPVVTSSAIPPRPPAGQTRSSLSRTPTPAPDTAEESQAQMASPGSITRSQAMEVSEEVEQEPKKKSKKRKANDDVQVEDSQVTAAEPKRETSENRPSKEHRFEDEVRVEDSQKQVAPSATEQSNKRKRVDEDEDEGSLVKQEQTRSKNATKMKKRARKRVKEDATGAATANAAAEQTSAQRELETDARRKARKRGGRKSRHSKPYDSVGLVL